jgi:hypothetical protein
MCPRSVSPDRDQVVLVRASLTPSPPEPSRDPLHLPLSIPSPLAGTAALNAW